MENRSQSGASRAQIWERVKKAAQAHHEHPQDRGIASLIAIDSGKTAQFVSDWKHGRAPIPMATLTKLAGIYGVSTSYLACLTDQPEATAPSDEVEMRSKMVELVEDVVAQLNPNAMPSLVIEMCNLCLGMLKNGDSEELILGALYKKMRAADPKARADS